MPQNSLYSFFGTPMSNALARAGGRPDVDIRRATPQAVSNTLGGASMFMPSPLGDLAGLLADGIGYAGNPQSLTPMNGLLSLAALVPGIPRKPVTVRGYHGTGADFDTFKTPAMFSTKRDYAANFAVGPSGRVIAADITLQNPADLRALHISPSDPNFAAIAKRLQAEGYDGAQYRDEAYIAFSPDQIKVVKP